MMLSIGTALAIGWCLGRQGPAGVQAAPPDADAPRRAIDYSKRVVAYIYGNIPITREDLGEYLIARYGAEKLDLLINKKIIEHACKEKGINVTGADIEADYNYMIRQVGIPKKDFVANVLKQYRKTEYEWREDVIRPRLMLTQFCKDRIQVTTRTCRMPSTPSTARKWMYRSSSTRPISRRYLAQLYDKVRQGDEAFDEEAKKQPDPQLAMTAGRIKPVGRSPAWKTSRRPPSR